VSLAQRTAIECNEQRWQPEHVGGRMRQLAAGSWQPEPEEGRECQAVSYEHRWQPCQAVVRALGWRGCSWWGRLLQHAAARRQRQRAPPGVRMAWHAMAWREHAVHDRQRTASTDVQALGACHSMVAPAAQQFHRKESLRIVFGLSQEEEGLALAWVRDQRCRLPFGPPY